MIDVGDADRPVPCPINQMLTNASGRLPQFSIFGDQSPKTIRPNSSPNAPRFPWVGGVAETLCKFEKLLLLAHLSFDTVFDEFH